MNIMKKRFKDLSVSEKKSGIRKSFRSKTSLTHGEWEEHKYIAKVKIRGDYWRYFYDKEEYANFLKKNQEDGVFQSLPGIGDVFSFFNNAGNAIRDFFSNSWHNIERVAAKVASFLDNVMVRPVASFSSEVIGNGQNFVDSLLGGGSNGHKYVARVRTASGEYRYFYSEEEYQRYLKRQEYQENEPEFLEDVPEYDGEMTMSENSEEVNPNYPLSEGFEMGDSSEEQIESLYEEMRNRGYDPDSQDDYMAYMGKYYPYSVNCSLCTLTYEMRERGYDVEAKPNGRIVDGTRWVDYWNTGTDWISTVYENPKSKSYGESRNDTNTISSDKYDILDDISNEPIGSRGEIAVFWTGGGGHSVAYTIGSNHEVTVRDTQTNDTYSIQEILERSDYIRYTRTDNLELSEECLQYVEYND